MNRKAQAALEFLTTYGWALLVILVMIGALVYFGLLDPSRALPARCDVPAGFYCKDFLVTNGSIAILIQNKQGEAIQNVFIMGPPTSESYADPSTVNVACGPNATTQDSVGTDDILNIGCVANPTLMFGGLEGTKVKIEFKFQYRPSRGTYNKTVSGTLYAPVQ